MSGIRSQAAITLSPATDLGRCGNPPVLEKALVMAFFNWWSSKKATSLQADSSGLSGQEATRPAGRRTGVVNAGTNAHAANRKGERMAQRELLYGVVRDAMMHAGVLSSSYKFKVLSLDSRGRQFMVMVDLAADQVGNTLQLAEIEALIAQSAKSRHNILVTAVYWRRNEHVAIGDPKRMGPQAKPSQPATLDSGPAPLETPAGSSASATHSSAARPVFEPILPAEVEAFKRALSDGPAAAAAATLGNGPLRAQGASARAFDGSGKHGPQNYTLLTGFEDTELPDGRVAALSGSQYGDLR
jgi:hypothetical protein